MEVDIKKLLHPELLEELLGTCAAYEKIWDSTDASSDFRVRLSTYMALSMEYMAQQAARRPSLVSDLGLDVEASALYLGPFMPVIFHAQEQLENPYNWSEVVQSAPFTDINTFMIQALGCSPVVASVIIRVWFGFNAWRRSQRQIYTVTPDLEWGLRNTELRGFRASNLRLPFPCVYIELPRDMQIWNADTGWHPADGAYLIEFDCVGSPEDNFGYPEGTRMWQIILTGKSKEEGQPLDDAVYYYRIGLQDDLSIEGAVEKALGVMRSEKGATPDMEKVIAYDEMESTMFEAFRYVMNVMVYCTSKASDRLFVDASSEYQSLKQRMMKAPGKKRDRIKKRLRGMKARPRILVGGKLYTGNRLRQQEHQDGDVRPSDGRRVKVRHIVAGHWREQACGPGWKDRRTTFIEPHWRGPEHAPLTSRQREVK